MAARIVVGIDGSDESTEAFRWALEEARLRKATLQAVHAWRDPYLLARGYGLPEDFEPAALQSQAEEFLSAAVVEVAGESSEEALPWGGAELLGTLRSVHDTLVNVRQNALVRLGHVPMSV